MSAAFLAIDIQYPWSTNSPKTTDRLRVAIDDIRSSMPIIWVYMVDKQTSFSEKALPAYNRLLEEWLKPAIKPEAKDWSLTKSATNLFSDGRADKFFKTAQITDLYIGGFLGHDCVLESAIGGIAAKFNVAVIPSLVSNGLDNPLQEENTKTMQNLGIRLIDYMPNAALT